MKILGISAFYHDSAAALIEHGRIVAAAQEERFSRIKQDSRFPVESVKFCMMQSGFRIAELDAVVFYDKPLLKFERLLETFYVNAPKGLEQFLSFVPVWLKEKLFLKKLIRDELQVIEPSLDVKQLKLLFPEHHISHAASAFFPSPFDEAAILTIDGVGEWSTATIMHGRGNVIKPLKEMRFPHSLGLLYSAFTYFLGFKVNSGEYKLMGMAPYGNPNSMKIKEYREKIITYLLDIKDDGSIWMNQDYFKYATGLRMINEKKWKELFGFETRPVESNIEQHHCDLAYTIQQLHDEIVIKMAVTAKKMTGAKYLCLAGGSALNSVSNGKLLKKGIFENIWIQPAAGDAGGALGAALAAYHQYYGAERAIADNHHDTMQGAYIGPEFSDLDTELMARKFKAIFHHIDDFEKMIDIVTDHLNDGKVVGWHQGRMEWGPRALGNRSILGDARNKEMQKKINLKIKYREGFRPFAPSVIAEDTQSFFDLKTDSPYMLLISDVVENRRKSLPVDYYDLPLFDRLYTPRSDLQSITHLDFSARIQTVHKDTNPRYHRLISRFKEKTGYGIIVNTSFNVRGEPIVCTPEDSFSCFMATEIDTLVIGNMLFIKEEQPEWNNKDKWKRVFALD
ncbi:MAG: carbamoyltransferase [Deltaproteobacteria bacterium]|nr:carbamoyltransferase [Deltaproteobacteria bacterium]